MAPRNRNDPTRAASSKGTYTRTDLEREFPDDATCLDHLWRQNFAPDGEHAECPKCETTRKFHRVASRPSWSCDSCGHHIHPTAGTIFHKSSTGLDIWFKAIFLMSSTRCGVSAKHIERELGVTYKTAWRMANLIRNQLMQQDDEPLSGEVEMDETGIGGKPRNADRREFAKAESARSARATWSERKKTSVFGAVERGGRVRAVVVPDRKSDTLGGHARSFVLPAASIFTDDFGLYVGIGREYASHQRVNHTQRIYVDGNVHTQTIEGFWALLKGGLTGTYHSVSKKWLDGYLNEFAWRYNHRDDRTPMFKTLLASACEQVS